MVSILNKKDFGLRLIFSWNCGWNSTRKMTTSTGTKHYYLLRTKTNDLKKLMSIQRWPSPQTLTGKHRTMIPMTKMLATQSRSTIRSTRVFSWELMNGRMTEIYKTWAEELHLFVICIYLESLAIKYNLIFCQLWIG